MKQASARPSQRATALIVQKRPHHTSWSGLSGRRSGWILQQCCPPAAQ